MQTLKISQNKRYLTYADGTPFFYLGDTAWELLHRLSRDEAEAYLTNRAAKKFTVIQTVALAEFEFDKPNPAGHLPLIDNDPTRPNEAYFEDIDWIIKRANQLGMFVGLLPTWGDKWNQGWGQGPEIFTPENADTYGEFLGRRYQNDGVIWVLGGDRRVETDAHRAIIRAMAAGLKAGDGGAHLMTFHPPGGRSASDYFPEDDWLDFDMHQSGHVGTVLNYERTELEYAAVPTRPALDGEPCYEDHPIMTPQWTATDAWFDDFPVRRAAYWSVFSGAHGHTYGCHDVWQMYDPARHAPVNCARTPWQNAIDLPGAAQMQHLRSLMESRPFLTRVPDQSLFLEAPASGPEHCVATRDSEGTYAFVYLPLGQTVSLTLTSLTGPQVLAQWYDPRTGQWLEIGTFATAAPLTLTPPTSGPSHDWVLVLDSRE